MLESFIHLWLIPLLNVCWKQENILDILLKAQIISLFKKSRRDDYKDYWVISLVDSTCKTYSRIISSRFTFIIENNIKGKHI